MACKNGHIEIIKLLLSLPKEYGIDPSARGNFAIRYASFYDHQEIVKLLLYLPKEYGVKPNNKENHIIWHAYHNAKFT